MEDSGGLSDALITTRDGIVGPWDPPPAAMTPTHHDGENAGNLEMWDPRVRAAIIDFELFSRIGLTVNPAPSNVAQSRQISFWHEKFATGEPPTSTYLPLARFDRPTEATFRAQLGFLHTYADLRPDRATEILEQLESPAPFLASIAFVRPDSKRWTAELIDTVIRLARFVEYRVKHGLACKRPIEFSPQVQPIILTPGHGSLPSGHATEAFASALVLWRLLVASNTDPYKHAGLGVQFMRLAARIAINRTVAGVHFPIDSIAGAVLGLTLGDYFVARADAAGDHVYQAAHFDGTPADTPNDPDGNPLDVGGRDFRWPEIYDVGGKAVRFYDTTANTHQSVLPFPEPTDDDSGDHNVDLSTDLRSRPLEWLWAKAKAEWT